MDLSQAVVALAAATETPETVGTASQWEFGAPILWALLFGLAVYLLYRWRGVRGA